LQALVAEDDEPDRLVATHLEALDDALIDAAQRFGDILGGRAPADADERDGLLELHRVLTGCASNTPRRWRRPAWPPICGPARSSAPRPCSRFGHASRWVCSVPRRSMASLTTRRSG
jgi:hypothetical protein